MSAADFEGINLPCNVAAEKSVLGCVFSDNGRKGVLSDVISSLRAEHFYIELHSDIYGVMARLFMAGARLDAVVILNECIKEGIFDSESEAAACAKDLIDAAPSASAISSFVRNGHFAERAFWRVFLLISNAP